VSQGSNALKRQKIDASETTPLFLGIPLSYVTRKVKKSFSSLGQSSVIEFSRLSEIPGLIQEHSRGVVVCTLQTEKDFNLFSDVMKSQKKFIKAGLLKVVVITEPLQDHFIEMLSHLGCNDILDPDASIKTLSHKIEQSLSMVEANLATLMAKKSEFDLPVVGEKSRSYKLKLLPPLETSADYFIFKGSQDVFYLMGSWSISLYGPPPSEGAWRKITEDSWEWTTQKPDSKGSWVFTGRKPEFIDLKWRFVGQNPKLQFRVSENKVYSKLYSMGDKQLFVCRSGENLHQIAKNVFAQIKRYLEKSSQDKARFKLWAQAFSEDLQMVQDSSNSRVGSTQEIEIKKEQSETFDLVVTKDQINKTIEESHVDRGKVEIWTDKNRNTTIGIVESIDSLGKCFTFKAEKSPDYDFLAKDFPEYYFTAITLKRARYFFKSKCLGGRGVRKILDFPSKAFEIQRRRDFRTGIGSDEVLSAEVCFEAKPEKKFQAIVRDASAGGVGLEIVGISEEIAKILVAASIYVQSVEIDFGDRKIKASGEIRHSRTVDSKTQYRFGIQFKKIRARDRLWLEYFVFERNRQYFLTWMLSNDIT